MEERKTKPYEKHGITFYPCFSSINGKKFFMAELDGYKLSGETEEEVIRRYKSLGKLKEEVNVRHKQM